MDLRGTRCISEPLLGRRNLANALPPMPQAVSSGLPIVSASLPNSRHRPCMKFHISSARIELTPASVTVRSNSRYRIATALVPPFARQGREKGSLRKP